MIHHASGTFNGSNNKYTYPAGVTALSDADATQDSGSPYMYDGSLVPVPKSQTDLYTTDGIANVNKQMYACFADSGNTGVAQYSVTNTDANDDTAKVWFECWSQAPVLLNGEPVYENGVAVTHIVEN